MPKNARFVETILRRAVWTFTTVTMYRFAIHAPGRRPPELASLLSLGVAAYYNVKGGMPDDVFHVLEKRRADPERLKRKLKEAYESLHDTGRGPLAELVAGQVKAALDSGTVATMITAKALVEETRNRVPNLDAEIPF